MTLLPVDSTDASSVHPTAPPLVAPSSTGVTKTAPAAAATTHTELPADEQTRSPTVIEASLDSNGVATMVVDATLATTTTATTTTATTTTASLPLPGTSETTNDKVDEVRLLPPPPVPMATTSPERCELEGFTPFSTCHLWKLMMSFYDREGVESWAQGIVPHFITSNTFIAKRYSNVLRAYVRDAMRPGSGHRLDPTEPFYIIELGAGSGKFSFYFLKALAEVERTLDFPLDQIRYIMTDFTAQNVNFWRSHPALAPFVARGIVDFATFDATRDAELKLECAQQTLRPQTLVNPLCVVANYLFDTLFHDLFQVECGQLKHGLISVGSRRAFEPDPLDPDIIKRLANKYKYEPIDESFYGATQKHLNAILQWYHEYFDPTSSGATVLVPIGALSAIERLSALSTAGVVVLSGDKGNSNPEHFRGVSDPHIAIHGSFSVMVNYHAIGIYCASRGGFALHSPQEEASLKVSVFVLPGSDASTTLDTKQETLSVDSVSLLYGDGLDRVCAARSERFPHLLTAFDDDICAFGPNDFFVLQKALKEEAKAPTLKAVLALLKLSNWDPDVFYKFRDVLLDHAPTSPLKLRHDVLDGVPRVWTNYYALDKEKDIAFEVGRLYYGLHDYDRALAFYTRSMREMGKHHVTSHNMGLCHYSKRQLALAATCFEDAYALNSSYQKAATWLLRIQKELGVVTGSGSQSVGGGPSTTDDGGLAQQEIELVMPHHENESARGSSRHRLNIVDNDTSPRRRPDAATFTSECTSRSTNCLIDAGETAAVATGVVDASGSSSVPAAL